MEEELTYFEKMNRPYTLLLDPVTEQAAAYNGTHKLITEKASKKLVRYGLAHAVKTLDFDAALYAEGLPTRSPMPAWATPDIQARMKLLWIRDGGLTDEEWAAIPTR